MVTSASFDLKKFHVQSLSSNLPFALLLLEFIFICKFHI